MNDKYYKVKHRIDFYLEENGITDLSKYSLGSPVILNETVDVINIHYWDYENCPKPTYEDLKKLLTKPNFIQHRNNNMILHKLEFILKINFSPGEYKRGEVI